MSQNNYRKSIVNMNTPFNVLNRIEHHTYTHNYQDCRESYQFAIQNHVPYLKEPIYNNIIYSPETKAFMDKYKISTSPKIKQEKPFIRDVVNLSYQNTVEEGIRLTNLTRAGVAASAKGISNVTERTISNVATQINRYTPDFYDVGSNGKSDLSTESAKFIGGQVVMVAQNTVRVARIPAQKGVKAINQALYNEYRIKNAKRKYQDFYRNNKELNGPYSEIITGQSRKDITRWSDRLAWNRLQKNQFAQMKAKKRVKLIIEKYKADEYKRIIKRKTRLNKLDTRWERNKFSLVRSTKGMMHNQSRKIMNQVTRGNDANSTTNKIMYYSQKGIRGTYRISRSALKHRHELQKSLRMVLHPIEALKKGAGVVLNLLSGIISFITSIPVIVSILALILPLVIVILSVLSVISSLIGWISFDEAWNSKNIDAIANNAYAANAFIYEAKNHNWKDDAIIGVLSYMLEESLGSMDNMGTFTYESCNVIKGPDNKTLDKLLQNDSWLGWLNSDEQKTQSRNIYKKKDNGIYMSMNLGLLTDRETWETWDKKTKNDATKLIQYASEKKKPWQDPETQLNYYFDVSFKNPDCFYNKGVDPTKDKRTAEEWCRRITAGYGSEKKIHWKSNDKFMSEHLRHLQDAKILFNNYKNFDYIELAGGNLSGKWNLYDDKAYGSGNPYYPNFLGQCTWFAWGRFYELYGYDAGFRGNGNECVGQLVRTHPDKFKISTTPAPGSVFSSRSLNHVGIVIDVRHDDRTNPTKITGVIIQDCNYDGKTNSSIEEIININDVQQNSFTLQGFNAIYNPIYAVPIK